MGNALRQNINSDRRNNNMFTGYNLELRDLKASDAGEYTCQIGSIVPKEIVHRLEVLVPPKIDHISPSGGRVDVTRGSSIRLECRAKGNPPPKIIWMRKVRKFILIIFSRYNLRLSFRTILCLMEQQI